MKKITLEDFWYSSERLAIHCKTEKEANKLLKAFDKFGEKWINNKRYTDVNHWEEEKENTCYDNTNMTSRLKWYKEKDYKIFEFENVDL